jgi:hypothetical protein
LQIEFVVCHLHLIPLPLVRPLINNHHYRLQLHHHLVIIFHPHHLIHRQLLRSSLPAVPDVQRREKRLLQRIPTIHRKRSRSGLRKRRRKRKFWRRTK